MKHSSKELTIRLAIGISALGLLVACGQRGPLYLPNETQSEREDRERAAVIRGTVINPTTNTTPGN